MPVRAKLIGRASDDMLSQFLGKLQRFNGTAFFQEALAEAVPTVRVLLSHASTTSPVAPKGNAYAARPYNVDPETQERIDGNTIVGVDGQAIRVTTDEEGSEHDRPLIPLADKLEEKWRAAIAQKINGYIRQQLALKQATSFLRERLARGPVQAYGFNRVARENKIRLRALREAKANLGVKKVGKGKKAVLTL